jgi:uncharacterized membrane protein HdeD (DUF308 family)
MNPRTKFFLAVVAVIAGCLILLTLPFDRSITKHAGEVFLGALLLVGGMIFLWREAKP